MSILVQTDCEFIMLPDSNCSQKGCMAPFQLQKLCTKTEPRPRELGSPHLSHHDHCTVFNHFLQVLIIKAILNSLVRGVQGTNLCFDIWASQFLSYLLLSIPHASRAWEEALKTLWSTFLSFVSELFAATFLSHITAPVLRLERYVCNSGRGQPCTFSVLWYLFN